MDERTENRITIIFLIVMFALFSGGFWKLSQPTKKTPEELIRIKKEEKLQKQLAENEITSYNIEKQLCEKKKTNPERIPIKSLNFNQYTNISGQQSGKIAGGFIFGMGLLKGHENGSIDTKNIMQYIFYREIGANEYKIDGIPAERTTIIEEDISSAYLEIVGFCNPKFTETNYKLHIPIGSISTEYTL